MRNFVLENSITFFVGLVGIILLILYFLYTNFPIFFHP